MMRPNPNHIDFSRSDAKSGLGVCPLRNAKVQLLALRYGLVERLDPAAERAMPYQPTSRPLGIRLVRDGWLYVIDNTLAVMRDLAQEQDTVVSWVDEWVIKERQELKYLVGSYIETLMVLNDKTASSTGVSAKLFDKTTAQQREAIYEYLNARTQLLAETTLRPVITDGGLTHPSNEVEKVRTLVLSFRGLSKQSLAEHSIRFTALWRRDSTAQLIDVGSYVRDRLCLVGNNPLPKH